MGQRASESPILQDFVASLRTWTLSLSKMRNGIFNMEIHDLTLATHLETDLGEGRRRC